MDIDSLWPSGVPTNDTWFRNGTIRLAWIHLEFASSQHYIGNTEDIDVYHHRCASLSPSLQHFCIPMVGVFCEMSGSFFLLNTLCVLIEHHSAVRVWRSYSWVPPQSFFVWWERGRETTNTLTINQMICAFFHLFFKFDGINGWESERREIGGRVHASWSPRTW